MISSFRDLSEPNIEPGSPVLQVGSLSTEPPGKPAFLGRAQTLRIPHLPSRASGSTSRRGPWALTEPTEHSCALHSEAGLF